MNKISAHRLRTGLLVVSIAASAGFAIPTARAQDTATEADQPDDVVKMEAFEVTGSRIKRIDVEGPNPVASISRRDLEISGFGNVGDALRSLPVISGTSLQPAASNNSFTPGASTVNLRGLGNNNVLVLINGRRAAPLSSPGYDGLQTMFDFNSIPTAAVESVEVLKDGGSAIYGSDAVSGVINVKLRRSYQGVSSTVEVGNTLSTDSLERSASFVFGANTDRTSIIATFDWRDRAKIKDADYSFSADADLTGRGGPDRRSYAGYPGFAYVPSLGWYYTVPTPMVNPSIDDFVEAEVSHGTYNFQSVTDLTPEIENYGFYTRAQHDFSDSLYTFAEVAYRRQHTVIEAAPAPVFSYTEHGDGPRTGTLNIPATNPNNPFGEDLEDEWYARLVSAGNRINDVTSETPRILVGLGGKIPNTTTWTWEVGALHTSNDLINQNRGTVFDDLYQDALNGLEIGGETLYANPFGPEDPRVTAYYVHENPNSATFKLRALDASASGDIFDLPAGAVGLAFGGEIRTEKFENLQSTNNITGNIIGGSEGSSVAGDRRVEAVYAELSVPIIKGVETQLAGRFENYSDFGSTTKPKVALSYLPVSWLRFRGSYGQSFLAPNLAYLYTSQVTQFSDSGLDDPKRPDDAPRQIQTRSGGNPDLQPEITDTIYLGFQLEPTGALDGLSIAVDWYEFKQKDLISQLGADFILANEDEFPELVVRNPPAAGEEYGTINYIIDYYRNSDHLTYRGFDFDVRYDWRTSTLGTFRFVAGATYMAQYNFEGTEYAGTYNFPEWRATFATDWRRGDWGASVYVYYIGAFENYSEVGNQDSQILVNPQVTYYGYKGARITLGVRNIFDSDPPFDEHSSTGWNSAIHDPEQAFAYLRISKDW